MSTHAFLQLEERGLSPARALSNREGAHHTCHCEKIGFGFGLDEDTAAWPLVGGIK